MCFFIMHFFAVSSQKINVERNAVFQKILHINFNHMHDSDILTVSKVHSFCHKLLQHDELFNHD